LNENVVVDPPNEKDVVPDPSPFCVGNVEPTFENNVPFPPNPFIMKPPLLPFMLISPREGLSSILTSTSAFGGVTGLVDTIVLLPNMNGFIEALMSAVVVVAAAVGASNLKELLVSMDGETPKLNVVDFFSGTVVVAGGFVGRPK
jgi:hypothetical protein